MGESMSNSCLNRWVRVRVFAWQTPGPALALGLTVPFVLMHDGKQRLPRGLQVSIEAKGWKASVEVTQKSPSPAARLSPRRKREGATRDPAGPESALGYGSAWGGSMGLLLVKQEKDFICLHRIGGLPSNRASVEDLGVTWLLSR